MADLKTPAEENSPSVYKVALASSDGKNVNVHYGRADTFYIFRIDDNDGYDLVETRKVKSVCLGGIHEETAMHESVSQFLDCRYVAASRIGSGASAELVKNKIIAMELPGKFDDAIIKIWKYNQIQNLYIK